MDDSILVIERRDGLRVSVSNVGAAITSIILPTSQGPLDAILSYDDPGAYLEDPFYLGSTVGPFANRISGAAFTMGGTSYQLDANDGERNNCLHGGIDGLHRSRFKMHCAADGPAIRCTTSLSDGHGGFPGNRSIEVFYALIDDWSLAIDYKVSTDKDTIVNLANHAYFNLGGSIDDHRIRVNADSYTPVDDLMIPTGELRDVANSYYDLRELQPLAGRQLDHNYVLEGSGEDPRLAAELISDQTEIELNVLTTQPAIQVYTGDYLDRPFEPRQGICLEAQGFPDAPNQAGFPSTRVLAGATYQRRTIYRFNCQSAL